MELTTEQIQEAIKANPALEAELVTYSLQTETGKTVLNNHLNNNKESIAKAAADEATANAYGNLDAILKDFGYEKQEGEKSTAAAKRVIDDLLKKSTSSKATKEEKEEAEKMIQAVRDQADEEKKDLLKQLEAERTTNRTNAIESKLLNAESGLKFNPNYDDTVLLSFKEGIKEKLIDSAKKQEDGSFIYYDDKGLPYLNDLRAPATEKDILEKLYKPILAISNAGGGAGKEGNPASKIVGGNIKLTGSYVSKEKLYDAFEKAAALQGMPKRTEKFNEQWENVKKQHDYENLPMR